MPPRKIVAPRKSTKAVKSAEDIAKSRHSKLLREDKARLAAKRLASPNAGACTDSDDDIAAALADRIAEGPRLTLIARVSRAIEQELEEIEQIAAAGFTSRYRTDAERRARTLASLARTLREMMHLRSQAEGEQSADDDDAIPRDLDEFRRELSRRLEAMVAGAKGSAAGDDVAS